MKTLKSVDGELLGEIASDLRNMDPSEANSAIKALTESGQVSPAALRILRGIQEASEAVATAANRIGVPFDALLNRAGDDFRFPQLQGRYRTWARNVPAGEDASPRAFANHYYELLNSGRTLSKADEKTIAMLLGILGKNFNEIDFVTKVVRPQRRDMWATFNHFRRSLDGTARSGNVAENFKNAMRSDQHVRDAVGDSISHIKNKIAENADEFGDLGVALSELEKAAGRAGVEDLIIKLLKGHSSSEDLADLRPDEIAKLVGRRRRAPQELIDDLVLGHIVLRRELDRMQAARRLEFPDEAARSSEEMMDIFLQIDGAEGFFQTVLSRTGWEHGYVFEQLLTFNVLQKLLIQSGGNVDDAIGRIIIQSRVGSKQGPDLLIVNIAANGKMVATLVQAKSFKDLRSLLKVIAGEGGGSVARGEIVAQAIGNGKKRGDIRRLLESGGLNQAADGADNIGLDRYDGVLRSKIDWRQLRREALDIDVASVRRTLEPDLIDPQTGKRLADLTDEEVILSNNETISMFMRQHVYDRHIASIADDVNSEIADFANTLASEVKQMDLATFRARYPEPVSGETLAAYGRLSQALGPQRKADDVIEAAFHDYYRSFFNLGEDEAVRIEFEIVDAAITRAVAGPI